MYSLLNTAYGYFSQGEPFPIDLEMKMAAAGLNADGVALSFEEGLKPYEVLNNIND